MVNFPIKIICALSLFTFSMTTYPQTVAKPVQIIATGIHYGGYVIYSYQVKNNGTQGINRITLGYADEKDNSFKGFTEWPDNPVVELPTVGQWYPPTIISYPDGWGGRLISTADEGGEIGIEWIEGSYAKKFWPRRLNEVNAPQVYPGGKAIAPGQTSGNFSAKLERPDYAYVRGYASVSYGDNSLLIPIEKGDTTPPVLTVSAIPAVLWPPNNKMVGIMVNLAVKDDYDPQPEIKLESITSSEGLAATDLAGADFGTEDRQFSLRASRTGNNLAGRIYTITYSATDGSGNKSTASTTVTVLHDQR